MSDDPTRDHDDVVPSDSEDLPSDTRVGNPEEGAPPEHVDNEDVS